MILLISSSLYFSEFQNFYSNHVFIIRKNNSKCKKKINLCIERLQKTEHILLSLFFPEIMLKRKVKE